ncbi:MAG: GNAT family N-acetyltransferase [Firmicutes bacterium]|nr:GNAT family N-acetyltransferase [Bacillota bacterium]
MDFNIIGVRENIGYLERAIDYFAEKWGMDRRIYENCISNSIATQNPLPRWFLMVRNEEIIGSYGLITNDFISRQDLYPWLCALYVEESYRGIKLGAKLLEHGRIEATKQGYKKLYLSTDHSGYYERHGWIYIGNGFRPWGAESRIYECDTMPAHGTLPAWPCANHCGERG